MVVAYVYGMRFCMNSGMKPFCGVYTSMETACCIDCNL